MTKKNVKKYTPQTTCEKIPVELCGPAGCGFVPGNLSKGCLLSPCCCNGFEPKSIVSIRDEVSGIGISETSFAGGLMP